MESVLKVETNTLIDVLSLGDVTEDRRVDYSVVYSNDLLCQSGCLVGRLVHRHHQIFV